MNNKVVPIYGLGLFYVRESGLVEQVVVFEYYDPEGIYRSIAADEKELNAEKSRLAKNMQYYLDQEDVKINGSPVYPRVVDVEIGFKGDYSYPYVTFFILFTGKLRIGLNIYEDSYEPEIAEYAYRVYWIFPTKARVVKADLGVPYVLLGNGRILAFSVEKGTKIRGYERIEFEIGA